MLFHHDRSNRLAAIAELVCTADDVTADLISAIYHEISEAHESVQDRRIERLGKLTEASAWLEAALVILKMELPRWKLRRLVYDDGQWHCALSLRRDFPDWLDDTIETSHPELPLSVLKAIVEAAQLDTAASDKPPSNGIELRTRIIQPEPACLDSICCDNFA